LVRSPFRSLLQDLWRLQGSYAVVGPVDQAVTIQNGIRGIGDLRTNDRDWRNPVARITIHRVF
jgi:hypothetical protein